jgi:hypothetical protein
MNERKHKAGAAPTKAQKNILSRIFLRFIRLPHKEAHSFSPHPPAFVLCSLSISLALSSLQQEEKKKEKKPEQQKIKDASKKERDESKKTQVSRNQR